MTILKGVFPLILSHNSVYEAARASLLMAKCLVALKSGNHPGGAGRGKVDPEDKRTHFLLSITHLKSAMAGFKKIKSMHRVKDVLYMMVNKMFLKYCTYIP